VLAFAILAAAVIAYASTVSTMQPGAESLVLPAIARPAYAPGEGPVVMVDEGHYNFHVFEGSDRPFLEYLRRDGYRVQRLNSAFTPELLRAGDILVVPMALAERNRARGDETDWSRPHPSAFSEEEIAAVLDWVTDGGALLVVADHPPLVGAVAQLATAFGIRFSDGFARETAAGEIKEGPIVFSRSDGSLATHPITEGRAPAERVDEILTFGGAGFSATVDTQPLLTLGASVVSMPDRALDAPRTPVGGWLQGAVLRPGKGRAAFFGEAGMFFAQLNTLNLCPDATEQDPFVCPNQEGWVVAEENFQLLLNVFHWLSDLLGD
jgi:hypothetical protein